MSPNDPARIGDLPTSTRQSADSPASGNSLSAVCVAKNAAATIEAALTSVRFCDEIIVVVDRDSTDDTESIARRIADRVEIQPWSGYGPTKRAAIDLARGQWILIIDSDEEVAPELAVTIGDAIRRHGVGPAAYSLKRRTRFLGRWMRHGDWGRDCVVRLFRRDKAELSSDQVHESVQAPGEKPVLDGLLLHEGDQTLDSYLTRLNRYTTLAAAELYEQGRRASWWSITIRPAFKFIQAYMLRLGFLDGWQGLVLACYSSVYVFTKYSKLVQLARVQPPDAK